MAGEVVLGGDWEYFFARYFDITDDIIMEFDGELCNILDAAGNTLETIEGKMAEREVHPGYRCYVIRAKVKFRRI